MPGPERKFISYRSLQNPLFLPPPAPSGRREVNGIVRLAIELIHPPDEPAGVYFLRPGRPAAELIHPPDKPPGVYLIAIPTAIAIPIAITFREDS